MKKKKESYFWTSYSDLMTSLFFIMLVLFVLVIVVLHNYHQKSTAELITLTNQLDSLNKELEKEKAKIEKAYDQLLADKVMMDNIKEVQLQFEELNKSETFIYRESSQKFIVKGLQGEIFSPQSAVIKKDFRGKALQVSREIEHLLQNLNKHGQFKYLLVIEGNCANDEYGSMDKDSPQWYKLSYERALALYNLWRQNGLDLRKYNTEIMICGSGLNGNDREKNEYFNKRFTIQIVPKLKPLKKSE